MNRTSYGSTVGLIDQITDTNQLTQMMRDPRYVGFTDIIIAKIGQISQRRQAAQGQQPPAPTVAQQMLAGAGPQPQQAMAKGGIVAFKDGGQVRKFANQGAVVADSPWYDRLVPPPSFQEQVSMQPSPVASQPETGFWHDIKTSAWGDTPAKAPTPAEVQVANTQSAQQKQPNQPVVAQFVPNPLATSGGGSSSEASSRSRVRKSDTSSRVDPGTTQVLTAPEMHDQAYYQAQYEKNNGVNPDMVAARAQNDETIAAHRLQAARSPWMAVTEAGLNMANNASINPNAGILGNFASGATAGLGAYLGQQKELSRQAEEDQKTRMAFATAEQTRRDNAIRFSTGESRADKVALASFNDSQAKEYGANKRTEAVEYGANKRAEAANASNERMYARQANATTQEYNYGVSLGKHNYLGEVAAYNADPTNNPKPRPLEEHIGEARRQISNQYGIASLNTDAAMQRARLTVLSKTLGNETDPVKKATINQQIAELAGGDDPSGAIALRR